MSYVIFDELGEIQAVYSGRNPENQGFGYIAGNKEASTHYIPDTNLPVLTTKVINPVTVNKTTFLADGVDSVVFTLLPANTKILLKTQDNIDSDPTLIDVTDGVFYIRVKDVGNIECSIFSFPYLDYEITLEAT